MVRAPKRKKLVKIKHQRRVLHGLFGEGLRLVGLWSLRCESWRRRRRRRNSLATFASIAGNHASIKQRENSDILGVFLLSAMLPPNYFLYYIFIIIFFESFFVFSGKVARILQSAEYIDVFPIREGGNLPAVWWQWWQDKKKSPQVEKICWREDALDYWAFFASLYVSNRSCFMISALQFMRGSKYLAMLQKLSLCGKYP